MSTRSCPLRSQQTNVCPRLTSSGAYWSGKTSRPGQNRNVSGAMTPSSSAPMAVIIFQTEPGG